jgi:predicted enzyme related to lactoylglutathione lyase
MPEATRHEPGSFTWAELATSDPKAAKSFYDSLFGWNYVDTPMGPGPDDIYTRFQLRGKDVGAAYKLMKEQREAGVPPNWGSYITVSKVDDLAKRVASLDGKLIREPFDVMDYGRMAVLSDPTGAVISLWQAGTHIGFERIGEPGTPCWTELATRDLAKSGEFYSKLIGWKLKPAPDGSYTELQISGGRSIGGMRPIQKEEGPVPPHWLIYVQVADCDATAAEVKKLGGKTFMPPTDIPKTGRFATFADPQGAAFAVIKLEGM